MALVREFASQEAGPPGTAITATRRRTKSAASTGQWIDLIVGPSGIQSIVEVAISVYATTVDARLLLCLDVV
jgi:hypothetical protein